MGEVFRPQSIWTEKEAEDKFKIITELGFLTSDKNSDSLSLTADDERLVDINGRNPTVANKMFAQ